MQKVFISTGRLGIRQRERWQSSRKRPYSELYVKSSGFIVIQCSSTVHSETRQCSYKTIVLTYDIKQTVNTGLHKVQCAKNIKNCKKQKIEHCAKSGAGGLRYLLPEAG